MRTWLRWFGLAIVLGMQLGTLLRPLGSFGDTRVADWVDLLTPFLVVGSAAMVLRRASATAREWLLLGIGALAFTLGHGMHLAANSISNALSPGIPGVVHLWDEVASHYIWYVGLFLVMAAVAAASRGADLRVGSADLVLGALLAVTLFNTYVEGGVPVLGLTLLGLALAFGLAWRPASIARLMRLTGGLGLIMMTVWGGYWFLKDGLVFPEYSELGWI